MASWFGLVASWFGLVVSRFKVWLCCGPLNGCWPRLGFVISGWFCLGFLVWAQGFGFCGVGWFSFSFTGFLESISDMVGCPPSFLIIFPL